MCLTRTNESALIRFVNLKGGVIIIKENPYRNFFHLEPDRGLLNDPNGLIQFQGRYYFFHQWNRFSLDHGYKEWGAFTSSDLNHWDHLGSAVLPDSKEDSDGAYSGSAIEHDNKMYLFYTGNTKNSGIRKTYQRMAYSSNGYTFIKSEKVIETPSGFTEHHRDPKVWQSNGSWWMIVGAQTIDQVGAINLFSSTDLEDWKYEGVFYSAQTLDQMCECPDYFQLGDAEILVVCPQKRTSLLNGNENISSYAGYLVGAFEKNTKRFRPESDTMLIDEGFDFYAPQSFVDEKNRRIVVGWMSRMDEAEEMACPTTAFNYLHCLTIPRELFWENSHLYQRPLEELKSLRKKRITLTKANAKLLSDSGAYELNIQLVNQTTPFEISMNNGNTVIQFDGKSKLVISRLNWVSGQREIKALHIPNLFEIQIFNDASAMEIFMNKGEKVFSMRYFCAEEKREIFYSGLQENGLIDYYSYKEEVE
jgi:beta-fructofuranosidase